ncbi:unnamed protein product [Ceratitis capitata]|uniref:(Mediterranean fruit fly) hypothetical protein n=1 Tax=Ceratitis capitata TaxID=7213 RepID=A0A811UL73_CERCA|nr:unnamed protein product [Ceratitis capitata]
MLALNLDPPQFGKTLIDVSGCKVSTTVTNIAYPTLNLHQHPPTHRAAPNQADVLPLDDNGQIFGQRLIDVDLVRTMTEAFKLHPIVVVIDKNEFDGGKDSPLPT